MKYPYPLLILAIIYVIVLHACIRSANACEEFLYSRASHLHNEREISLYVDGVEVGSILYSSDTRRTYVEFMQVNDRFKRMGYSSKLLKRMIELAKPTHIQAVLAFDNWSAAEPHYRGDYSEETPLDMCMKMVQNTPFFRALAKHNYAHITECVHQYSGYIQVILSNEN